MISRHKSYRHTAFRWIAPGLCGSGIVAALVVCASAHPFTSPSMRAAARLKKHPPTAWLRHYLPDDRYKVAGGIWKVVSTESDTYFHRPNCPHMMRQPAGAVIGFPSAGDAIEAGYIPDPLCRPAGKPSVQAGNSGKVERIDPNSALAHSSGAFDSRPQRDPFADQVAGLIAQIQGASSEAATNRLLLRIIGLKQSYQDRGDQFGYRKAGVMQRLVNAITYPSSPSPATRAMARTELQLAQGQASTISRESGMTAEEKQRQSDDFFRKMLEYQKSATQKAASREVN